MPLTPIFRWVRLWNALTGVFSPAAILKMRPFPRLSAQSGLPWPRLSAKGIGILSGSPWPAAQSSSVPPAACAAGDRLEVLLVNRRGQIRETTLGELLPLRFGSGNLE